MTLTKQLTQELGTFLKVKIPYPHLCAQEDCSRCKHLFTTRRLTSCEKYHKGTCNPAGLYPHATKMNHELKALSRYHGSTWANPLAQKSVDTLQRNISFHTHTEESPLCSMDVDAGTSTHSKQVESDNHTLDYLESAGKMSRTRMFHMRPGQLHLPQSFELAKRHIARIQKKYPTSSPPSFSTLMYKMLFSNLSRYSSENGLSLLTSDAQANGCKHEYAKRQEHNEKKRTKVRSQASRNVKRKT